MLGSVLLGVLLTNPAVVLQPQGQPVAPPAAAATAQDPADKPWPPDGVRILDKTLKAPEVITEMKPRYTEEAMRRRIQGRVEMEVVVRADGSVGPVRVVESLDREYGLDEQAIAAVKGWKFRPGQKDGVAVPVLVKIELTFTLRDKR